MARSSRRANPKKTSSLTGLALGRIPAAKLQGLLPAIESVMAELAIPPLRMSGAAVLPRDELRRILDIFPILVCPSGPEFAVTGNLRLWAYVARLGDETFQVNCRSEALPTDAVIRQRVITEYVFAPACLSLHFSDGPALAAIARRAIEAQFLAPPPQKLVHFLAQLYGVDHRSLEAREDPLAKSSKASKVPASGGSGGKPARAPSCLTLAVTTDGQRHAKIRVPLRRPELAEIEAYQRHRAALASGLQQYAAGGFAAALGCPADPVDPAALEPPKNMALLETPVILRLLWDDSLSEAFVRALVSWPSQRFLVTRSALERARNAIEGVEDAPGQMGAEGLDALAALLHIIPDDIGSEGLAALFDQDPAGIPDPEAPAEER